MRTARKLVEDVLRGIGSVYGKSVPVFGRAARCNGAASPWDGWVVARGSSLPLPEGSGPASGAGSGAAGASVGARGAARASVAGFGAADASPCGLEPAEESSIIRATASLVGCWRCLKLRVGPLAARSWL